MARQTADETRAEILRAAAALFARNGYHATGITELSEATGIGRARLYYYIGSKEQILFDLSLRTVVNLVEDSEKIVTSGHPPEEQLLQLARNLMRNIADNLDEWTVFFREHGVLTGDWRDEVMLLRDRYESYWNQVLSGGVADNSFVPVSHLGTKAILGMFNYSYLWLRPGGESTPDEIAEEFCRILLAGLRR